MVDLLTVGLDGAGNHLLGDWINSGVLPTLSELQTSGASGTLQSTLPPVTCPAWRCITTGSNPGKLGVFWWENFDKEKNELWIPDSTDFGAPDIWDYTSERGKTMASINIPTTYPPSNIDGIMISGIENSNSYTHPPAMESEIESAVGYVPSLNFPVRSISKNPERLESIKEAILSKLKAAEYIIEEYNPDHVHVVVFHVNSIQHYNWGGDRVKEVWKMIDAKIGDLSGRDDVRNTMIVSDHGSNEIDTVFNINRWLKQEGYLQTTTSITDKLADTGITKRNVGRILEKCGLVRTAKSITPGYILDLIPDEENEFRRSAKESKIQWEQTTAFAGGQGPVYLLDERYRDELKSKLEDVTVDGKKVAKNVWYDTEVYSGQFVNQAPDLIIEQNDGVHISGALGRESVFTNPENWKWESENHRDGIFIGAGEDFRECEVEQASVYDIAPTSLALLGLPPAARMDGSCLESALSVEAPDSVRYELEETEGEGMENPELQDRLEDLGYLS